MRLVPLKRLKAKCRVYFNQQEAISEEDLELGIEALSDEILIFTGVPKEESEQWAQKLRQVEISLWVCGAWKHYQLNSFGACHDEKGVIPGALSYKLAKKSRRQELQTHLQLAEAG